MTSTELERPLRVRTRPDDPHTIVRQHLAAVPVHRALIRSAECRLFIGTDLYHPLLDVGCGDGHFATMVFAEPVEAGIDSDPGRVAEAARRGCYRACILANGGRLPFANGSFASVMSNCVLEHIPDVDAVLREVARVLRPGGRFAFSVPSPRFGSYLLGSTLLRSLGLGRKAQAYERWFNRISHHYHCDDPVRWGERLGRAALAIDQASYYLGPDAHRFFDASHYYGAPTLLTRRLTGRWVLLGDKVRYWPPERWLVERLVAFSHQIGLQDGAYIFFVAHKAHPGRSGRDASHIRDVKPSAEGA